MDYSGAVGEDERIGAVRQVLPSMNTIELPWPIAGGLVLLFGQPAQCIAELRTDQVDVADGQVRLLLARDWLHVPEPFASLLREYLGRRRYMATAANASARWLFPGGMPGRPVTAASILGAAHRRDSGSRISERDMAAARARGAAQRAR